MGTPLSTAGFSLLEVLLALAVVALQSPALFALLGASRALLAGEAGPPFDPLAAPLSGPLHDLVAAWCGG